MALIHRTETATVLCNQSRYDTILTAGALTVLSIQNSQYLPTNHITEKSFGFNCLDVLW